MAFLPGTERHRVQITHFFRGQIGSWRPLGVGLVVGKRLHRSSTTGELARAYDRFGVLGDEDLGMRPRQAPGGDGLDGLRWPGEAEYLRTKRRIKGLMRAEALAGDEFRMAIGNRSRMIEAFAPTTVWRRTVMAGLPADGRTGAYLATLAGCLRAAPLCRSVEGFRERQCACGHTTSGRCDDLDVHFLLGAGRDGVKCKCAVRTREEWHERVFETLSTSPASFASRAL